MVSVRWSVFPACRPYTDEKPAATAAGFSGESGKSDVIFERESFYTGKLRRFPAYNRDRAPCPYQEQCGRRG